MNDQKTHVGGAGEQAEPLSLVMRREFPSRSLEEIRAAMQEAGKRTGASESPCDLANRVRTLLSGRR